jgi:hypothetical protein
MAAQRQYIPPFPKPVSPDSASPYKQLIIINLQTSQCPISRCFPAIHSHNPVGRMLKHAGHMLKQMTHMFKQMAHMFKQMTHMFKQMTHMFKQITHMFKQMAHMLKQMTHNFNPARILLNYKS